MAYAISSDRLAIKHAMILHYRRMIFKRKNAGKCAMPLGMDLRHMKCTALSWLQYFIER
jgi:hypothetical protein